MGIYHLPEVLPRLLQTNNNETRGIGKNPMPLTRGNNYECIIRITIHFHLHSILLFHSDNADNAMDWL